MTRIILVPLDGSSFARKALEFACEYGAGINAELHLLHVAQPVHENHSLAMGAITISVEDSREDLLSIGEKILGAAVDLAGRVACEVVKTHLREGDPAKAIVATAREIEADMIIIGNRGLGDLAGVLLGSVSNKVSHLAPCTCITVR